jgi:hypothetical protein
MTYLLWTIQAVLALARAIARAYRVPADPVLALLAGCRAYCRFGIRKPGHYRILFEIERPDLGPGRPYSLKQSAGGPILDALVAAIELCRSAGVASPDADTRIVATSLWSSLHGVLSLRLNRPRFPWPPLDQLVDITVQRLVGL